MRAFTLGYAYGLGVLFALVTVAGVIGVLWFLVSPLIGWIARPRR